jgi:HAMP domain-containing protein
MALLWLLIAVVVEAMSLVPDPSPCLVDIEGYVSVYSQQGAKGCAPLHIVAMGSVGMMRALITQNHDLITAISSAVIAFFVFMLWISTRRLLESTKRAVEDVTRTTIARTPPEPSADP